MKKYIIAAFAFATLLTGSITFTACEDIDDIHELSLDRLLSPTNLIGKINSKVNITASWDAMDDATAYTIEFYKEDPNCEGTPVVSETIEGTEFTKEGLDGETEYTIRVKSIAEGLNDSKWAVITRSTEVTEQILNTIKDTDISDKTVNIKWDVNKVINNSKVVAEIQLSWTDENKKSQKTTLKISDAEVAANAKTISELLPSTTYELKIKNDQGKTLGVATFTTKVDLTKVTKVEEGDDLIAVLDNAKNGDHITIIGGTFDIGNYALKGSITIAGYYSSEKPIIKGRLLIKNGAPEIASLSLTNIIFDGTAAGDNVANLLEMDAAATIKLDELKIENCEIRNYKQQIIYNKENGGSIGNITINNCIIDNIEGDGGDSFDIRKGTKLKSLTVTNTTFSNGSRAFLRCQTSSVVTVSFIQCTFYQVCTFANKGNTGLFLMDQTTDNSELIVKQCIFYGIGEGLTIDKNTDANSLQYATWIVSGKMKATETYDSNYYYDCINLWNKDKGLYKAPNDKVAKEADPQFADAANGDFTVGNKDLAGNEIGDPRWIK